MRQILASNYFSVSKDRLAGEQYVEKKMLLKIKIINDPFLFFIFKMDLYAWRIGNWEQEIEDDKREWERNLTVGSIAAVSKILPNSAKLLLMHALSRRRGRIRWWSTSDDWRHQNSIHHQNFIFRHHRCLHILKRGQRRSGTPASVALVIGRESVATRRYNWRSDATAQVCHEHGVFVYRLV